MAVTVQPEIDGDLLLEREAAALLRSKPQTLANQRSQGTGPPFIRLGNRSIRYSRRALLAYLAARTVVPEHQQRD